MTKTITIEIPVKEYYQQEFQKLKNRETGLRQKIKNSKNHSKAAQQTIVRCQREDMDTVAQRQDVYVRAHELTKQQIIEKLNEDYSLIVGCDLSTGDDCVMLHKLVEETPEEILERIECAKSEIVMCNQRIEEEKLILQNLEKELTELEAEIKGFWKDPIHQANLANA